MKNIINVYYTKGIFIQVAIYKCLLPTHAIYMYSTITENFLLYFNCF